MRYPNRLAVLRVDRGLTQHQVANDTDQHVTTVCRHESGERPLNAGHLEMYADFYGVKRAEIMIEPTESPE